MTALFIFSNAKNIYYTNDNGKNWNGLGPYYDIDGAKSTISTINEVPNKGTIGFTDHCMLLDTKERILVPPDFYCFQLIIILSQKIFTLKMEYNRPAQPITICK